MVSTNLVVPVVLWGPTAPTHCVSSVFLSDDQTVLVTGCYDGQICLWQVEPTTLKMSPRCLLVGHTAPVLCLVRASILPDNNFLVSSSENGEMSTWDLTDGKCTETVKLQQVHTQIQSYHTANSEDARLFCIGYYPEIMVMDPFSLEVIYSLSSKVKPDWISALHVLRPMRRKDDVVLAITTTGTVKVWTLTGNENKLAEPIYENESKEIRCLNAITMNCCSQNQRTVLIVCSKYWQIYDAGDFTVLCSVIAPTRERWQGGDFIASDRVMLWTDEGKGYLYKLPANCIPDNKEFHSKSVVRDAPYLYYMLQQPGDKILSCPPAMKLLCSERDGKRTHYLLRGDSEGFISLWTVPDVPLDNISISQAKQMLPRALKPTICTSLVEAWSMMDPPPVGILDQLSRITDSPVKLTSSIYLPQQSRLVIGREDGTIVIVPATQTVMMQLLVGIKQNFNDWPSHQILYGHRGRVNCLLCPSLVSPRYEKSHLISGGVDFAVCLWDLYSGTLIHRFCVHAGEITQLLVPPETCSSRILKCICSVASDHSVTLLSLQERKCVTLASRHLFPVVTIKWRPIDDFMVVGCSDGSVYVWQMETGHLDRVLHGMLAEEVMNACDEQTGEDNGGSGISHNASEMGMANPAVHFFRGLKSRNMNAIRHATQRGIHQLQQLHGHNQGHFDFLMKHRSNPLVIQGLRTNPKDAESHILFFDIEGLIFELHSEEYAQMTPEMLEAFGIMVAHTKDKPIHIEASKKISDFFGKVKNKAGDMEKILKDKDKHGLVQKFKEKTEIVEKKVQAKVESFQKVVETHENAEEKPDLKSKIASKMEVTHVMEVAQLLLSLLHSWGLDPHLDKVCESQLGLLRPMVPISFGVLSKAGYMSLLLPTWQNNFEIPADIATQPSGSKKRNISEEMLRQEQLTAVFTSRLHWELSTTITSNHILALVAMSNTLMSMTSASFLPDSEKSKKLLRLAQRTESTLSNDEEREELIAHHTSQIKQGWSLLSTHHCFLLPDKIEALEPKKFKRPQVEAMAKRWQHHCIEIREAAQQILLGELTRMGKKGRKQLVESWAQYLPLYTHTEPIAQHAMATNNAAANGHIGVGNAATASGQNGNGGGVNTIGANNEDEDYEEEEEEIIRKPSSLSELKRKQTTAVILLGVIGAEFGQDISQDSPVRAVSGGVSGGGLTERRKSSVAEGFGIANNLARLTSMALAHLLHAPPSQKLPKYTPLRRAAIDLLGRGFTVWEPYLDVSKVLLGLLEIASEGKNVPNLNYKLPLTPQADACRTARHALRLIATARPAAFITTMAREVARYNSMQQNAQSVNAPLQHSVLFKAKSEILQIVEMLIDKMQAEIAGLLVEVMDITLHCVENSELKSRGLIEVCPAICKFNQISHCSQSRRIAVGASNGHLAIYELRQNKCQMIPAHTHPITSLAFSPDGKHLVSYSCSENRLSFWQTSTGMFGLGQSQTRCTKGYSTAPIPDVSRLNPMRLAKLVWINNRTVTLMLADGSETRFNV